MKSLLQSHADPAFGRHWTVFQVALFLLPFSAFLGGVPILILSLVIWTQRFSVLKRSRLNQGFALLGLLMILTACFALDRTQGFLGLFNFLPFFIAFPALSFLIQTPDQLRQIAWIFVATSVPINLIGLAELFLNLGVKISLLWGLLQWSIVAGGTPIGRMSSVFTYANILASYSVIVFVLGLALWIEKPKVRASLLPILLLNAIALVLTNSRNAWAIALLVCVAFALYQGWKWMVAGVGAISAIFLGAAFAPAPISTGLRVVVPRFIWARLNDEMYSDRPFAQLRSTQWKFAWSMTQQRPFTGWGFRSFSDLYTEQMRYWLGHPHNLFFMLSAETGLIVTLLFCGLVGWVIAQGALQYWLETSPYRLWLFAFLIAFLACTLFSFLDITLFDARINLMGWLMLAGVCGLTPLVQRGEFSGQNG